MGEGRREKLTSFIRRLACLEPSSLFLLPKKEKERFFPFIHPSLLVFFLIGRRRERKEGRA